MDFTKYLKFIPKIFHFVISFIFYGANLEIVHELSFWSSYTNLSWSLSCPPCQNSIFVGLIIYPPQKSGKGTSPFTNFLLISSNFCSKRLLELITWLWCETQAPIWLPFGRERKYFKDSVVEIFSIFLLIYHKLIINFYRF